MPDPAYRVAREVARRVALEHELTPPFDLDRLAAEYALVLDEPIPVHADVVVLHADEPGVRPRIVVDAGLEASPERRRFALAHGLGHVLLGWHPLGAPCDVSTRPHELPVTVHDLVEGEASAFARELLLPSAWIAGFDAFDRPAMLVRHVADRAGVSAMPAARAVALQLLPHHVWVVSDQWDRVVDAGRSPGTIVRPPALGSVLEAGSFARHARERHRDEHGGCSILVWRFDAAAADGLPIDRSAARMAADIARDLGLDEAAAGLLGARLEGIAGWANEQLGTASLDGMRRSLRARVGTVPELAAAREHPDFEAMLDAKATELVAKRLAR